MSKQKKSGRADELGRVDNLSERFIEREFTFSRTNA
jgi:hypothetical protein